MELRRSCHALGHGVKSTNTQLPTQQLWQSRSVGIAEGGERAGLVLVIHSFAAASCKSFSVLPSLVFQSTRPLAARPWTTPAAVEGDGKT